MKRTKKKINNSAKVTHSGTCFYGSLSLFGFAVHIRRFALLSVSHGHGHRAKERKKKTFHIIFEGYFMIIIVFNNYAYKVGRRERAAAAIGTMTASVQSFYAQTTAKWRHILLHRMRLFVWGRYCLLLLLALPFPISSHLLVEQVTRLQSFFFFLLSKLRYTLDGRAWCRRTIWAQNNFVLLA